MTDYSFDISQNCVRVELTEELVALPFSCGDDDLDDFFHNHALLYGKEHLGKTYVFINNDTSEIVAFFTVSNDSIKTTFIPKNSTNRVQRKIPGLKHLRTYPAVLIGRLGVSKSYQGKDFMIGRQIVNFIKLWFLDNDNKTAYNKLEVLSFYERNGFKYLYATEEDERNATQVDDDNIHTRLMFLDLLHTTLI